MTLQFQNNTEPFRKPKSFTERFKDLFDRTVSPVPDEHSRSFLEKVGDLFFPPEPPIRIMFNQPRAETKEPLAPMQASPTPTPTPTATPTPSLFAPINRIDPFPVGPETPKWSELYSKLQKKEAVIQPSIFDAIIKHVKGNLKQRLAFATVFQESTGGLNLIGDEGKSFGPAHIQPGNAPPVPGFKQPTKEEAMDPEWTAKYLNAFMDYNELGVAPERVMRRWNFKSGYENKGPKYDVDIPRFATMSAFVRKD